MYDVSERSSFDHVTMWLDELNVYSTNNNLVKMLVGNKIDKVGRAFTRARARAPLRRHHHRGIAAIVPPPHMAHLPRLLWLCSWRADALQCTARCFCVGLAPPVAESRRHKQRGHVLRTGQPDALYRSQVQHHALRPVSGSCCFALSLAERSLVSRRKARRRPVSLHTPAFLSARP